MVVMDASPVLTFDGRAQGGREGKIVGGLPPPNKQFLLIKHHVTFLAAQKRFFPSAALSGPLDFGVQNGGFLLCFYHL